MNSCRMAPKYNPLDDVPHSVRQNLSQPSPSYSIVTDSGSSDGHPQTQVILGLYWDNGRINGSYYSISGL